MCCIRPILRETHSPFDIYTFKDKILILNKNLYTSYWENLVPGDISERRDSVNELWIRQ
jgi:hypothetical protein